MSDFPLCVNNATLHFQLKIKEAANRGGLFVQECCGHFAMPSAIGSSAFKDLNSLCHGVSSTGPLVSLLYPFIPRKTLIVDFGVRLAGTFGVPPRVQSVAVRDVSMMCRLVVRT